MYTSFEYIQWNLFSNSEEHLDLFLFVLHTADSPSVSSTRSFCRRHHCGWRRFRLLLIVQFLDRLDLLLLLHASVLEPDLDLSLRQTQHVGQFDAATSRQVSIELKLLLQLEGLVARVRLPSTSSLIRVGPWNRRRYVTDELVLHFRQRIVYVKAAVKWVSCLYNLLFKRWLFTWINCLFIIQSHPVYCS